VSGAIQEERPVKLPEQVVRNRSRFATQLHRQDPDVDEHMPACPEADYREDAEWAEVPAAAYESHYDPCRNPECFGRDWR